MNGPDEFIESFNDRFGIRYYIFKNGKIIESNMIGWSEWFANFENRRIDLTDISNEPNYPGGDNISTVFLGLPHGHKEYPTGEKLPYLFETMVFGGQFDSVGWRYCTYGEAKKGHWQIVDSIRAGNKPELDFGERPPFELFMEMFKEEEGEDDE